MSERESGIMLELWQLAEQARAKGDARRCYLLTLAGNLIEATATSNPPGEALRNAEANANNIVYQDASFPW